jgi:hypothetical protein
MLKKCLKYDLRAIHRIWWILAVTLLGASLVVAFSIRAMAQNIWNIDINETASGMDVIVTLFGGAGAALGFIAMAACLVVSLILVYWRTYTHFYTDEGYLTFTLPVKRSTLYLSKVITAAIVEFSTGLLFVLGIAIILLVAPPTENGALINPVAYTGLWELLREGWALVGGWMIVWVLAFLPIPLLFCLVTSGMTMLCITVGAVIAKKHKLIAAIGIYYGVTTVLSFVGQLIMSFLSTGIFGIFGMAFTAGMTPAGLTVTAVLIIASALTACLGATLHFITVHMVEHKLNLA